MISSRNKIVCGAVALLVALSLCGCGSQSETGPAPTEAEVITLPTAPPETVPETTPKDLVEHLDTVLEAGQLYTLEHYPNLKSVNLSGSTCYGPILDFIDQHPQLDVTFTVSVGNAVISNKETGTVLSAGTFDYDMLMEGLQYLPGLTSITLPDISLNAQQVSALQEAYPHITLDYTVELFGNSFPANAAELDLTQMTSDQVEQAIPKLGLLTALTDVHLSDSLTKQDVNRLQEARPNTVFHYSFSLFGKNISTADKEVVYKGHSISDAGEAELREALSIMDSCERFVLDNCGLSNEVLAGIREDFRDGPKVVWRVYFGVDGRYNLLTDAETLRAVYNVTDDTCGPMKYCEDVRYMDIGHNEYLTDLSFIGYMPNIEVVIASGCAVKELVGLENCKKLTWLELAYCYKLTDIDCLAGCESLRFLNLSFSKVSSFLALDGLPLERFVYLKPKASTEEQNIFISIHPKSECITVFYGYSNPYGYGWRYDDNGKTFNEYYKTVVREAFNYDLLETYLPKD